MEASSPSPANVLTGTIAGGFTILKLLGVGGMGQVYQAEDTKLKRIVAIKRMAPRLQEIENDRRRFLREDAAHQKGILHGDIKPKTSCSRPKDA